MFKRTAPLIDTIRNILKDITSFMIILIFFIIGFAICFYLMGQNQLNYDEKLDHDKMLEIPYNSMLGSIWYVYFTMVMGNQNIDSFNDKGDKYHLYLLYVVASFIMIIVLLNLLIAIMGNTFGNRNEVAE